MTRHPCHSEPRNHPSGSTVALIGVFVVIGIALAVVTDHCIELAIEAAAACIVLLIDWEWRRRQPGHQFQKNTAARGRQASRPERSLAGATGDVGEPNRTTRS